MTASNPIEVVGLTKKFGDFTAVDNISFSVKKGQCFAFLGPNGAGKSTTIKMLMTLLRPTKGSISVNGFNAATERNGVLGSCGIVFQDSSLDDDLTAYENLEFHRIVYRVPKKISQERIEYLLKLVDLWDRRHNFVRTYSGGMKRRLEIARGLVHHPKILFLDEPTLGLDPQTRNHLWSYVKNLNEKEGMTVFFTTHYMEEAQKMADMVAIIDNGQIITTGTSAQIMKSTGAVSLEDAFLELTGKEIRSEQASSLDNMRSMSKVWGKR